MAAREGALRSPGPSQIMVLCLSPFKERVSVIGLDWIGFTSGYRVSTALRIVYWPSLSLLGRGASRLVRLFQLTIPPKVTICRESIIMLFDGKCNLVTRATLHNSYEFKVVMSLPVRQVTNPSTITRLLGLLRGLH